MSIVLERLMNVFSNNELESNVEVALIERVLAEPCANINVSVD